MTIPVEGTFTGEGDLLMVEDKTQQYDGALNSSNTVQNNGTYKTTLLQTQPRENTVTLEEDPTETTKTQTGQDPHEQDNIVTQRGQQKRGDDPGEGSERDYNTSDAMDTGLIQHNEDKTPDDATLSPKRTKKMRVDKSGEQQNERTLSMTLRAALKRGKM
jgi:hypothetical protein